MKVAGKIAFGLFVLFILNKQISFASGETVPQTRHFQINPNEDEKKDLFDFLLENLQEDDNDDDDRDDDKDERTQHHDQQLWIETKSFYFPLHSLLYKINSGLFATEYIFSDVNFQTLFCVFRI